MSGIIGTSPNMNSGILGKPPIGSSIQRVHQTGVSGHENSGNSTAISSSSLYANITSMFANSKFRIVMHSFGCHNQDGAKGKAWIMRSCPTESPVDTQIGHETSAPGLLIENYYNRASSNVSDYSNLVMTYLDSPGYPAGSVIAYRARYSRPSGSNHFYFAHSGYAAYTEVIEISN